MNLFVKLSNFSFVFGLSLDCFHRSRLSEEARTKKKKIGQVFGHLVEKFYSFFHFMNPRPIDKFGKTLLNLV